MHQLGDTAMATASSSTCCSKLEKGKLLAREAAAITVSTRAAIGRLAMEHNWQQARLIPVSGISKGAEAEQRATSALLAVLQVVRPFSKSILSPLGASRADRAHVESFIEVSFKDKAGKVARPDGLIRVTFGKADPWIALVEVKTGKDHLDSDQLNRYFDIAGKNGFDAVITVSNEIAPSPGAHPCEGLKVRSNSKVQVHHFSWTMILAEAVQEKQHRGVSDPEQAWILGELIRYLEHDSSGAMDFDDMGPSWAAVRDGAREGTLSKRGDEVQDIAQQWAQLLRFAALKLGSDVGDDVQEVIPRSLASDPKARAKELVDRLCDTGTMVGTLRAPNTAGDIDIVVDLKARQIVIGSQIEAPDDRGGRARVSWLTRQLRDADPQIVVEAYGKNARNPEIEYLGSASEDATLLLGDNKKDPVKFRLVNRTEMGMNRKTGRKPGFVDSVINAIEYYYSHVLQELTPFQRKATKIEKPAPSAPYLALPDGPQQIDLTREEEIEVVPIAAAPSPAAWSWTSAGT